MSPDRSLDEFLSQSDTTQDGETDDATPGETDEPLDGEADEASDGEVEARPSALTVHPARSTMAWTVDDTTCDACGEIVQRRWRDDDQLVCSACKEW
jgi:formylmethanofuran dehydrogenase subunit E